MRGPVTHRMHARLSELAREYPDDPSAVARVEFYLRQGQHSCALTCLGSLRQKATLVSQVSTCYTLLLAIRAEEIRDMRNVIDRATA